MPEKQKTEFELFCEALPGMSVDQLEAASKRHVAAMNAHTNIAQEHRNHWLVIKDEQKRRMRK